MRLQLSILKYETIFQSIFFVLNTLLFILGFFNAGGFWILLVLAQIPLGIYQLGISGTLHLFFFKSFSQEITSWRTIHYFGSIIYLVFLFFITSVSIWNDIILIFLILIPQMIAHAYFFLTLKDYRSRKDYLENRPTIFAY